MLSSIKNFLRTFCSSKEPVPKGIPTRETQEQFSERMRKAYERSCQESAFGVKNIPVHILGMRVDDGFIAPAVITRPLEGKISVYRGKDQFPFITGKFEFDGNYQYIIVTDTEQVDVITQILEEMRDVSTKEDLEPLRRKLLCLLVKPLTSCGRASVTLVTESCGEWLLYQLLYTEQTYAVLLSVNGALLKGPDRGMFVQKFLPNTDWI